MDKNIPWWATSHDNNNDWTATWLGITKEMIPDLSGRNDFMPKFNQADLEQTKDACTIVNAYRSYCYQTQHEFTVDELLKIITYAYTLWFKWNWWSSSEGMMCVKKYFWNTVSFVTVSYNDPLIGEIYKKRNALGITYKGNKERDLDSSDGVLDEVSFWVTTYGHRTSTIFYWWVNIVVDDSFNWTKWNIYQMPNLVKLITSGYIYPTMYLWIPLKNTDRISELNKFKVNCETTISLLNDKLLYTKDSNYIKYIKSSINTENKKLIDISNQLLILPK